MKKLGDKDFLFRLKIARKEAKESLYWLRLLSSTNETEKPAFNQLLSEAEEPRKIVSSIINKSQV